MVADTGIGIPAEELPLLGKRFHRVQTPGGRSHEGTGIGTCPPLSPFYYLFLFITSRALSAPWW
jgi:hypothetical protein